MHKLLPRSARLIRLGAVAELRNPGMRVMGIAAAIGAGAYACNMGSIAGSTAVVLAAWLGRAFGAGACLWFAYSALRDQNERSGATLRSKPVDGGYWVLVNWLSGLGVWLSLVALCFLAAALAQMPAAGPTSLLAHAWGFGRAALTVVIVGTLSFALSRMMRSPLGGIIILFAWFCTMGGLQFVPAYLRPDYAQNRALFLPVAAVVLCVAALLVERFRRGELRRPLFPVVTILVLALAAAAGGAHAYSATPRLYHDIPTIWGRIADQHIQVGHRVPGFWLPDGRGGTVRTASYPGKVLLIYIFAADDMDAARALPALERIRREFGERGVQPIGVTLSPDHGDGVALARTGGYGFPIGSDITTVKASVPPETAVAAAYNIQLLPMLVVTDRAHRVHSVLNEPSLDVDRLRQIVNERIAAELE